MVGHAAHPPVNTGTGYFFRAGSSTRISLRSFIGLRLVPSLSLSPYSNAHFVHSPTVVTMVLTS